MMYSIRQKWYKRYLTRDCGVVTSGEVIGDYEWGERPFPWKSVVVHIPEATLEKRPWATSNLNAYQHHMSRVVSPSFYLLTLIFENAYDLLLSTRERCVIIALNHTRSMGPANILFSVVPIYLLELEYNDIYLYVREFIDAGREIIGYAQATTSRSQPSTHLAGWQSTASCKIMHDERIRRDGNRALLDSLYDLNGDRICSLPACHRLGKKCCSKCLAIWYCCPKCANADWKRHKLNCPVFRDQWHESKVHSPN